MPTFTIDGKRISVFPGGKVGGPAIYLHTFSDEGQKVFAATQASDCPPFTLVAISDLDWNHDMVPWNSPPAFKNAEPCTGGADDYLRLLTEEIMGSMSGSLWFPRMKDYIFSYEPKRWPDCMYFSLGDKESKTRNPVLRNVRQNTEEIQAFYQDKGIDTVFQLNSGNHYDHATERTAAGLCWLLSR